MSPLGGEVCLTRPVRNFLLLVGIAAGVVLSGCSPAKSTGSSRATFVPPGTGGGIMPSACNQALQNVENLKLTALSTSEASLTWSHPSGSSGAYRVAYAEGPQAGPPPTCSSGTSFLLNSPASLEAVLTHLTFGNLVGVRVCPLNCHSGESSLSRALNMSLFWQETRQLQSQVPENNQRFGNRVSLQDEWLAVGAPQSNVSRGAVYLYQKSSSGVWQLFSELGSSLNGENSLSEGASFGSNVFMRNNWLAVGAQGANQVFLFQFTGSQWEFRQRLAPGVADEIYNFGAGVALSNDLLAVSAQEQVRLYQRGSTNLWSLLKVVTLPEGFMGGWGAEPGFGRGFALNNTFLFVGARNATELSESSSPVEPSGRVFIYSAGAHWENPQVITPSEPTSQMLFGASLAASENYLAVSAPQAKGGQGVVFILKKQNGLNWEEIETVEALNTAPQSFGNSLSITDRFLAVGVPDDHYSGAGVTNLYQLPHDIQFGPPPMPGNSSQFGSVTVFERQSESWVPRAYVKPENVAPGDEFGRGVFVFGAQLAVGAPKADIDGGVPDSGKVFTFELGVNQTP